MILRIRLWLHSVALSLCYPAYGCEQCVGQEWWQGCYCDYHGAVAPCEGPERWRVLLRRACRQLGLIPNRKETSA